MSTCEINKYNELHSKEWDIDETVGIILHKGKYVKKNRSPEDSYLRLLFLDQYMQKLFLVLRRQFYKYDGVKLLLNTPHIFQEMSLDDAKFEGINKPKHIIDNCDNLKIKMDNSSRASYRLVMLRLQNGPQNRSTYADWEKVKKLLLHELAHTMCNHLKYRTTGNHLKDFKDAEALLYEADELLN